MTNPGTTVRRERDSSDLRGLLQASSFAEHLPVPSGLSQKLLPDRVLPVRYKTVYINLNERMIRPGDGSGHCQPRMVGSFIAI
jgi:hypothetical protein